MYKSIQKNRVLLKYALLATVSYIFYFIVMQALGYARIPELRFINYFIYFLLAYGALYDLVRVREVRLEFLEGMAFTFILGAVSFLMFAFFVLLYSLFSPVFMEIIGRDMQSAARLGIWGPAFIVCAEGFGISSVVSLCMMQYFQAFSSTRQLFLFYGRKIIETEQRKSDAWLLAAEDY